ncbi:MAG: tetratricopeptide repeat protein, partial [Methanomicrobiales archaeon]|nr:tetratricopeptide repeat protein [Methanomicrobiales archaeon]
MAGPEHYFGKSIALLKSGNISEGKTLIENMPRPSANSQNINNKADNNSQNNLSNQQRNDNFSGKISYGEIDRCIQSGDISHALILLQKLLSDDSYERITIVTDVDELVKAGNQAQQNNDFEGALEFFNQAITNGSSRPDVYAGMGFALDSMGQYENATEYFNKALEVDPNFKPAIEGLKRINENIENDNPNGNMSLINELVEKGNKAQTENYPDLALSYFLQALDTGIIRPDV